MSQTELPRQDSELSEDYGQSEHLQQLLEKLGTRRIRSRNLAMQLNIADTEVHDLFVLSQDIRNLPPVALPDQIKADVRERMLAEFRASQQIAHQPDELSARRMKTRSMRGLWQLAAVMLIVFGVLFGGNGVIKASAGSLPGEPLYGIKRLVENVELFFASVEQRGELLLHQAQTRLTELQLLTERQITISTAIIEDTLQSVRIAMDNISPAEKENLKLMAATTFSPLQQNNALDAKLLGDLANTLETQPELLTPTDTITPAPTTIPPSSAPSVPPTPSAEGTPIDNLTKDMVTAEATANTVTSGEVDNANQAEPSIQSTAKPAKTPKPKATKPANAATNDNNKGGNADKNNGNNAGGKPK